MSASLDTPLPEAFDAIAKELNALATITADVQALVGPVLGSCALAIAETSERLQQLDLVTQHLQELATFVEHLGRTAPASCGVATAEAAKAVRLTGLAQRLGQHPAQACQRALFPAGDTDWF